MYKTRHDINQLRQQAEMLNDDIKYFRSQEASHDGEAAFFTKMATQLEHEQNLMQRLADCWQARLMGQRMMFTIDDQMNAAPAPDAYTVAGQAIDLVQSTLDSKTDKWIH